MQVLCPGQSVQSVELYNSRDDNVIGEEGDALLWKVRSRDPEGARATEFVIGNAPSGFIEEVPLTEDLSKVKEIGVLLEFDEGNAAGTAYVRDIEPDTVVRRKAQVSVPDFLRAARRTCADGS